MTLSTVFFFCSRKLLSYILSLKSIFIHETETLIVSINKKINKYIYIYIYIILIKNYYQKYNPRTTIIK